VYFNSIPRNASKSYISHDNARSEFPMWMKIEDVNSLISNCDSILCPNNTNTGECYCFQTSLDVTWSQAKFTCSNKLGQFGGRLAVLPTQKQAFEALTVQHGAIIKDSDFSLWLGATKKEKEMKWTTGPRVSTETFPSMKHAWLSLPHSCLVMDGNGTVQPADCNPSRYGATPNGFICEKRLPPLVKIPEGQDLCHHDIPELREACDNIEARWRASQTVNDTEVPYPIFCKKSSCYLYALPDGDPVSWIDARMRCKGLQMDDLVSFNDKDEMDYVTLAMDRSTNTTVNEFIRTAYHMNFWIGLTNYAQPNNQWRWVDKTANVQPTQLPWPESTNGDIDYTSEHPQQCMGAWLNGDNEEYYYSSTRASAITYRSVGCTERNGFVCEVRPDKAVVSDNSDSGTLAYLSVNDIALDMQKHLVVFRQPDSKAVFFVPRLKPTSLRSAAERCQMSMAHKVLGETRTLDAQLAWLSPSEKQSLTPVIQDADFGRYSDTWVILVDAALDPTNKTVSWNVDSTGLVDTSELPIGYIGRGYERSALVGFASGPDDRVKMGGWFVDAYRSFPDTVYALCRTSTSNYYQWRNNPE
jgi:hypothetical protein